MHAQTQTQTHTHRRVLCLWHMHAQTQTQTHRRVLCLYRHSCSLISIRRTQTHPQAAGMVTAHCHITSKHTHTHTHMYTCSHLYLQSCSLFKNVGTYLKAAGMVTTPPSAIAMRSSASWPTSMFPVPSSSSSSSSSLPSALSEYVCVICVCMYFHVSCASLFLLIIAAIGPV
jgi:hypothetical protein